MIEQTPDTAPTLRWSLCYDRFGGQVTTFVGLKISDIKETIVDARNSGNTIPVQNNTKAWMLKHVITTINKDGENNKPLADRVVIIDNKL